MKFRFPLIAVGLTFAAIFICRCGGEKNKLPQERELAKVRNSVVVQTDLKGFDDLTLTEKSLAYYLSSAAICGDMIAYKQNHRSAAEIKLMLDGVMTHSMGIKPRIIAGVREYSAMFYLNHGFHLRYSGEKYLPLMDFPVLHESILVAISNGARVGYTTFNDVYICLRKDEDVIFNPDFELTIPPYRRFGDSVDDLTAQIIRTGNDTLAPGIFVEELIGVVDYLRKAVEFAEVGQANILNDLADAIQIGSTISGIRQNESFKIDAVIDFLPDFLNPESDSIFTGLVFMDDIENQLLVDALFDAARKTDSKVTKYLNIGSSNNKHNVKTVQLITASGSGMFCPPDELRYPFGNDSERSNNYIFTNVVNARNIVKLKNHISMIAADDEKVRTSDYFDKADILKRTLNLMIRSSAITDNNNAGNLNPIQQVTLNNIFSELYTLYYASGQYVLESYDPAGDDFFNAFMEIYIREILIGAAEAKSDLLNAERYILTFLINEAKLVSVSKINGKIHINLESREKINEAVGEKIVELITDTGIETIRSICEINELKINEFPDGEIVNIEMLSEFPEYIYITNPKIELKTTKMGKVQDVIISVYPDAISQAVDYRVISDR